MVEGSHLTYKNNACIFPKIANWLSEKGLLDLNDIPSATTCHLHNISEMTTDISLTEFEQLNEITIEDDKDNTLIEDIGLTLGKFFLDLFG